MAKLIYSMSVSLDGYIAGPNGEIDWSVPDDELHRFHNQQVGELAGHFLGRRLYETMVYWETADQDPALSATQREFAQIWKAIPKVVYSATLDSVEGNTTLRREVASVEIEALKANADKDLAVGGAGLAATFTRLGLIDEYHLFVCPVILGGGTPYFPQLEQRIPLELVEARKVGPPVLYLVYRRAA
jgi:dihydrofolate reductase